VTLLTLLFEHRAAEFAADGTILVGASSTPNLVTNPSAATVITGWTEYNPAAERVASIAGIAIPGGTAIYSPAENGGTVVESDPASLGGFSTGDFLYVQAQVYVGEVATGDVNIKLMLGLVDGEGNYNTYVSLIDEAYIAIPGFRNYSAVVEIPDSDNGVLQYFTVYATVDEIIGDASDDAELYLTQVQVREGVDGGTVPAYGPSLATMTVTNTASGSGTIGLAGTAWLSPRAHGQDTFVASGNIRIGGLIARKPSAITPVSGPTRLTSGETWSANDGDGWTAPDVTPPDIREDA